MNLTDLIPGGARCFTCRPDLKPDGHRLSEGHIAARFGDDKVDPPYRVMVHGRDESASCIEAIAGEQGVALILLSRPLDGGGTVYLRCAFGHAPVYHVAWEPVVIQRDSADSGPDQAGPAPR